MSWTKSRAQRVQAGGRGRSVPVMSVEETPGWHGLEGLEPRVLFAADLVGQFSDQFNPLGPTLVGDEYDIPVTISNIGDTSSQGLATFRLVASEDLDVSGDDFLLGQFEDVAIDLIPEQEQTFRFQGTVPFDPGLAPLTGDPDQPRPAYNLLVEIVPGSKSVDREKDNNVINHNQSGRIVTLDVRWAFGEVENRRGSTKFVIVQEDELDPDFGQVVTFQLNGDGVGELLLDEASGRFGVVLSGTSEKTKVKVKVKGGQDGRFLIGGITADSPVMVFDGKTVDLLGDADFSGGLAQLKLGDVDASVITIGPAVNAKPITVELDRASGVQIDSLSAIKSLRVSQMLSDPGDAGSVTAPSIAKLDVRGNKKRGLGGHFQAGLDLDGSDGAKKTLGRVKIAGDLGGGGSALQWDVAGAVGQIDVKGGVQDWQLQVDGDMDKLKAGVIQNAHLNLEGGIKSVDAVQWDDGQITAVSVGSIRIKGDKKDPAIHGDFNAALDLNPQQVELKKALGKATIAGGVDGRVWTIAGHTGKVQIKGDVDNWTLNLVAADGQANTLDGLKLGVVKEGSAFVDGVIKSIDVVQWDNGAVIADAVQSIKTKGDKKNDLVTGDFDVDLTLTGSANPKVKKTLGKAKIAGAIDTVAWNVTGDSGKIDVGGQASNWTLNVNGHLDGLKLTRAQNANVDIQSDVRTIDAIQWDSGSIAADSIRSLKVTGDKKDPAVAGDFLAGLTLRGPAAESKAKQALGHGNVAGNWGQDAVMKGDVGAIKFGRLDGSVTIEGDVKSIQAKGQEVALNPPVGGESGTINVAGQAKIKGTNQTLEIDNDTFFTADPV